MTPKPQAKTIDEILDRFDPFYISHNDFLRLKPEATQAINAYYLAEVLDMIGEDIKPHTVGFGGVMGLNTSDHTANKLKADYRKAAKERFS